MSRLNSHSEGPLDLEFGQQPVDLKVLPVVEQDPA